MKLSSCLLAVLLLFHGTLPAQNKKTKKDPVAGFDAYVQQAIKDWRTPGLAIVVVKNNEVVFKKSYGTRNLQTGEPVNDQTLFVCASTTKAMTATCMGMLVDQGKVDWDDPVIKYLPEFRLKDPFITRSLTIRDLFLHNSGLGNTDYLWVNNHLSKSEILAKLEFVEPSYSFRAGFVYQNIMYLVAGQVIEKITGLSWSDFVTRNIFQPLGMNRTKAILGAVTDPNLAQPHYIVDSVTQLIQLESADSIAPAGSVMSSIDDISLWMKCMLDSSKYAGGRLVKPETWIEMLRPQTIVPAAEFYPTMAFTQPGFITYALGWFQQDYKGRKLNFHTGSLAGMVAIHGQIPAEKTGVYIFANLDHTEIRHALMYKAFDMFALGGDRDWSSDFLSLYSERARTREQRRKDEMAKQVQGTKPTLALSAYAGVYRDTLLGTLEVREQNGLNIIQNNIATGKLQHFNYDSFLIVWDKKWDGTDKISFNLDGNGRVKELKLYGYTLTKEK